MSRHFTGALPTAYVFIRILIVLNWIGGALILALLMATILREQWTLTALGIATESSIAGSIDLLRIVAFLGLLATPLNHVVLIRLLRMIETVRTGDPFISANAHRLNGIGWALLGLQLLSLSIGGIGDRLSAQDKTFHLDAGFSPSGWLAVLLAFVLARVFATGKHMRDDLEGTI